jgi:hypothetical protein
VALHHGYVQQSTPAGPFDGAMCLLSLCAVRRACADGGKNPTALEAPARGKVASVLAALTIKTIASK